VGDEIFIFSHQASQELYFDSGSFAVKTISYPNQIDNLQFWQDASSRVNVLPYPQSFSILNTRNAANPKVG
jgi:hypothetical protein